MASEAADGKPIGHHFAEWWERGCREGGQPGKRAEVLARNAFVAILSTLFVTNLSPRAVVRVKNRALRAGFLLHNPFRENGLCDGARRGIRTPDQLCVRQMCGWGG
jgi:hypothetical protein